MNQKQLHRIETYIREGMTASEKVAFEAELAADPALAEQTAMLCAQLKVAELLVEDDLREAVKVWKTKLGSTPGRQAAPGKIFTWRRFGFISLAASLLVLLYFLFLRPGSIEKKGKEPEGAPPEDEIYAAPHQELLLDTVLALTPFQAGSGPAPDSIELLIFNIDKKPAYNFDGYTLELWLPKDSLGNSRELGVLKSNKNTGEIFYLKIKNKLYPIVRTDPSEMKRL